MSDRIDVNACEIALDIAGVARSHDASPAERIAWLAAERDDARRKLADTLEAKLDVALAALAAIVDADKRLSSAYTDAEALLAKELTK